MARGGDADTEFGAFVATRQRRLQQAAWLLTGDMTAAEDLVQDALAKAWRHWRRVQAAADIDAYVRRLLVNTFVSSRRRRWHAERPSSFNVGAGRDATSDPDVALRLAVRAALVQLPPRQRGVVVLRFFEDMSVEQVADALGWPVGTVKSTTAKALARLREADALGGLLEEVR